ncbi:MAG: hypothetical protein EXR51_06515 [Dehalococcoidia bacterium]|nr:hypothetical protein [Dehalococcoidia bacterium]
MKWRSGWLTGRAALLLLTLVLAGLVAVCESQQTPGAAKLQTGGEFRINMRSEPDTINPNRSNFSTSLLVAAQVFEGLFV